MFEFFEFLPQIQNFVFSGINAYKVQIFEVVHKTEIYAVNLCTSNAHTNFKVISLFFPCNGKKAGKGDDVTFLKYDFWAF